MRGRVLVTAAAGFIGSHVVDALLARGYEVTALDNLQPQVHADAELDVSRIASLLGWAPTRAFEAGMEELIDWVSRAKPPVDRSRASLAELEASRLVI